MTLRRIHRILETLATISSRIEKEAYIKRHWDNVLERVVLFAYNDDQYNMTDIPWTSGQDKVEEAFAFLLNMAKKRGATDVERNALALLLPDAETADVFTRILNKDLKCGCGIKTWEKFVPELADIKQGVMLCNADLDKFMKQIDNDPTRIMSSLKLDGVRCTATVHGDEVIYQSRNGKRWYNFSCFDADIKRLADDLNCNEFDGEVTLSGEAFDDLMGQVRRLENVDNSKLVYNIFDAPGLGHLPLLSRYAALRGGIPAGSRIRLVEHWSGWKTIQQILDALDHVVSKGHEGLVIKDADSLYERKRSNAWLKMKKFQTEEIVVTGVQPGTGKFEGTLGALICDFSGVEVKVGSGYTDAQRHALMAHPPIGQVIEVKYFEKTKVGSLRFPIFMRIRDDKN